MVKRLLYNFGYSVPYFLSRAVLTKLALWLGFIALYGYLEPAFAFNESSDGVAELKALTTDVTKLVKNGCYITGTASALIGAVFAVAQQSLKIFAVAAAVTLLAFKAPSFFSSAMLI